MMKEPPAAVLGAVLGAAGVVARSSLPRRRHKKPLRTRHTNATSTRRGAAAMVVAAAPHAGVSVGPPWGGVRGNGRAYGGWAAGGRDDDLVGQRRRQPAHELEQLVP